MHEGRPEAALFAPLCRHRALQDLALARSPPGPRLRPAQLSLPPGRGSWLLGEGPRPHSGRYIWVFLARGPFAAKPPLMRGWIPLDFLGFSRQNQDLSMGYARVSLKENCSPLSRALEAPRRETGVEIHMEGRESFIQRA